RTGGGTIERFPSSGAAAMNRPLPRRALPAALAGGVFATAAIADDKKDPPVEAERDYPAPKFKPQFRKPQLGKTLVQDCVIYPHSDLEMVKKLLEKEPALLNATQDWGGGDWETGLGGASHMGNRAIAE